MGTLCLLPSPDYRNQSHLLQAEGPLSTGLVPNYYPMPPLQYLAPLPLFQSQLQSPFAVRPCAYCGDTDTSRDHGEEPHLWPSRLSSPTPHHSLNQAASNLPKKVQLALRGTKVREGSALSISVCSLQTCWPQRSTSLN